MMAHAADLGCLEVHSALRPASWADPVVAAKTEIRKARAFEHGERRHRLPPPCSCRRHERLFRTANEIHQALGLGEHMGGLERVGTTADVAHRRGDYRSAADSRL